MIKELVKKNRSYRGYDESVSLSREELLELVDTARFCASGTNKQILKFHLVNDRETVDKIVPITTWAGRLPEVHLPREGKNPSAFIIICLDHNISPAANQIILGCDMGIAAQTMLLAAAEKGLGGIMMLGFSRSKVSEMLNLPEEYEPVMLVALGKPDEEIRLVDIPQSGSTNYWRDENDVHYVPKRSLEELVIGD